MHKNKHIYPTIQNKNKNKKQRQTNKHTTVQTKQYIRKTMTVN